MGQQPKTRPTAESFDAYVARQPENRREDCRALDALMREATGESAVLWGEGIVGYGRYLDRRKDGTAFEWPVAGFASRKQDLVVYLAPGFDENPLLQRLGPHRASKACLYLKRMAGIDQAVLAELIHDSVRTMEPRRVR